jgi:hypothetical protein
MNTCPICLSAKTGERLWGPKNEGTLYSFSCKTVVTQVNGKTYYCDAARQCLAGAKRIQDAMDALYNAFGYDADAACTPEQRLARSEYRKITMDRDGKECVE